MDAANFLMATITAATLIGCGSDKKQKAAETYDQQLEELRGKASLLFEEMPDLHFYLFGMGNREKLVYANKQLRGYISDSLYADFTDGFIKDTIMPDDYSVKISQIGGVLR